MARQSSPDKVPDSIPILLWMMLKGMVLGLAKHLVWKLLLAAGAFFAVMGINYYYVAVRNEGFGQGPVNDPNSPLYGFFNVGANQAVFNVWVFLGGMLLSTVFGQIRSKGFKRFFRELFQLFHWTGYCIAEAKRFTLPAVLFPMALTVALGIVVNSLPLFITLAVGQFFGYVSQNTDLTSLFARCGWFDLQRIFRRGTPRREINVGVSGLLSLGMLLGAVVLALVPPMHLRTVSVMLSILLVALGVLSLRGGRVNRAVAVLLVFVGINLLWFRLFGRSFADDGGADEVGGTILDYARDPGGRLVLANGAKSGFFGALGTFVGSGFNWMTGKMAKVANAAADGLSKAGSYVADGLSKAGSYVSDGLGKAAAAVKDTAKEGLAIAREFVIITWDDAVKAKDAAIGFGGEVISVGRDLINPRIFVETVGNSIGDIVSGVKDIWNHPEIITDTLAGSWQTTKEIAKGAASGIWQTITDPKKTWEFIKEAVGANDYGKSLDPNIPAHQRIGHSLVGTLKLGMTLLTAGQAKVATTTFKTALQQGLKSGLTKTQALRTAAVKTFLPGSAGPVKGGLSPHTTGPVARPTGAPKSVPRGPKYTYTPTGKAPKLSGMTNKAQKAIRTVASEMDVQIHMRPTSMYSKGLRTTGNCLPKPSNLHMKSLNSLDPLLGGPVNSEGVIGLYKPKLPPKDVFKRLHPKTQRELVDRYKQQRRAWNRFKDDIPKDCELRDGVIYKKGTKQRFCSDNDGFDVTDANGNAVPEAVKDEAMRRARVYGGDIEHGHHMSPKFKTPGGFERKGKMSIINNARGAEGLNTFNPDGTVTHTRMGGRQIKIRK